MDIRRFFLVFSLGLFSLSLLPASAQANPYSERCPRHDVQTSLKAKKYKTKFYHNTLEGINQYLNEHSVMAFVEYPFGVGLEYKFDVAHIGEGFYCVKLQDVKGKFWLAPRIVMPKDFKRGSCEYNLILEHEKRHLGVLYDFHEQSLSQFQTFLGRIARTVPVFQPMRDPQDIEKAQQDIRDYFENAFNERILKAFMDMKKLQAKIDSPQEYLFTNRRIDRCAEMEAEKAKENSKVFYGNK